jgi:hypothetical protein
MRKSAVSFLGLLLSSFLTACSCQSTDSGFHLQTSSGSTIDYRVIRAGFWDVEGSTYISIVGSSGSRYWLGTRTPDIQLVLRMPGELVGGAEAGEDRAVSDGFGFLGTARILKIWRASADELRTRKDGEAIRIEGKLLLRCNYVLGRSQAEISDMGVEDIYLGDVWISRDSSIGKRMFEPALMQMVPELREWQYDFNKR